MLRMFLLICVFCLTACEGQDKAASKPPPGSDSRATAVSETQTQLPDAGSASGEVKADKPRDLASQPPVGIELYNENLYQNENGEWMLDAIAGQLVFIDVTLIDREQIPVRGEQLEIASSRDSKLTGAERKTDQNGSMQFAVRPRQQGEERITVAWGSVEAEILLNVISDAALQWEGVDNAQGVVPWETLLGSRVTYMDDAIRIDFSEAVRALDGEEISVIGFMMPVESGGRQTHFLLVSTPPSCFFHMPGGPVGAIEVFAEKGLEFDWDPVRLKGRFKLFAPQEYGAVYQLREAKQEPLGS